MLKEKLLKLIEKIKKWSNSETFMPTMGITALSLCAIGCILAIIYVTSFELPPNVEDKNRKSYNYRIALGIAVVTALIIAVLLRFA